MKITEETWRSDFRQAQWQYFPRDHVPSEQASVGEGGGNKSLQPDLKPFYLRGRFLAPTIRLLTVTLERLNLAHPNLETFTFYLLGTF